MFSERVARRVRWVHRYVLPNAATFCIMWAFKVFWYLYRGTDETGYTPPKIYWFYAASFILFTAFFLWVYLGGHMLEVVGLTDEDD